MKWAGNEKGLTLVEILAALVILGIFFISIMAIFPQMTIFNEKTETKLDTMNLARQEMAKITSSNKWIGERNDTDPSIYETFQSKVPIEMAELSYLEDTANTASGFKRFKRSADYLYEADIFLACEPFQTTSAAIDLPCSDSSLSQLYKVHLKVFKGNQLSSETYSYIKFSVEKPGE